MASLEKQSTKKNISHKMMISLNKSLKQQNKSIKLLKKIQSSQMSQNNRIRFNTKHSQWKARGNAQNSRLNHQNLRLKNGIGKDKIIVQLSLFQRINHNQKVSMKGFIILKGISLLIMSILSIHQTNKETKNSQQNQIKILKKQIIINKNSPKNVLYQQINEHSRLAAIKLT